jgi:DNA-binding Lrp family transcriptional regulator
LINKQIDSYDLSIIDALAENSDITANELSAQVHLSRTAVARRIVQLKDNGLLGSSRSTLDFKQLGFAVRAIIHISSPAKGSFNALDNLISLPEVLSISVVVGKGIFVADTVFRDTDHMHQFLSNLPGASDSETHVVLKMHESEMSVRDRLRLVEQSLAEA